MAPAKSYKVLVSGEAVFYGPFRTASVVYEAILLALRIVCPGSDPVVVLAFDL